LLVLFLFGQTVGDGEIGSGTLCRQVHFAD